MTTTNLPTSFHEIKHIVQPYLDYLLEHFVCRQDHLTH
jgi:hypothetical protein